MRNTKVLGRAMLDEQNLAPESGNLSLSLLQVPPLECHDTYRTAELNLRSGLEQFSLFGRVLCLAESPSCLEFLELVCSMAASDSESSMSGVDVTITAVHPSPFREPAAGDEFDGQEVSFEPPESKDIHAFLDSQRSPATPVSSSSDAEVPELTLPASSTDFKDPTPAKKRQQRP